MTLTVAQLNEYVRRTLASDPMLRGIRLRGEISNFKRHTSGHLYFTLKDEAAQIGCVMFRDAAAGLAQTPRDGLRVVLTGSASLYAKTGQYQFYVDGLLGDGVGALYEEFERRKARLMAEGLFDPALKKPLPLLPRGVGVVTSATGAVLQDILRVAGRRHPGMPMVLRPSAVQGEAAPRELARAIAEMDACAGVDVLIVGRGGGSLEELWAFNEEIVVRAIFACAKPVVSAVGHETDFTLADFVADVRAATPSQAAELAVPKLSDLSESLKALRTRLRGAQARRFSLLGGQLHEKKLRLSAQGPDRRLAERRARLSALRALLQARAARRAQAARLRVAAAVGKLSALSPDRVLGRGFALVTDEAGAVLRDARKVAAGAGLIVRLEKGSLRAKVTEGFHAEERK